MSRSSLICMLVLGLVLSWGMVCADDDFYVIPVAKKDYAPVERTGQTTPRAMGDDGAWQMGVPWPSPRFTDNGNGTVTDNLTELIWLKNANCPGTQTWSNALTFANSLYDGMVNPWLGDCGLSDGSSAGDWRLPNVKELLSLIHYGVDVPALPNTAGTGKWKEGDPFTGVQNGNYWSSTTHAGPPGFAFNVYLYTARMWESDKANTYYVWPVRGGQSIVPF